MALLKKIWKNNSKHKKLCEEWAAGSQLSLSPTSLGAGPGEGGDGPTRQFQLKYVGAAAADRACSAPATAAAVSSAIAQAKRAGKKLRRVTVTVSPKGILVEDAATSEKVLDISIYRISYCSADALHRRVFAFIAQGGATPGAPGFGPGVGAAGEVLECHTFLCPKRKAARAVTLAAAHSFNTAYQQWQSNQDRRKNMKLVNKLTDELLSTPPSVPPKSLLIDLYNSDGDDSSTSPWVSFDEEGALNLWDDPSAARLLSSNQLIC